MKHFIKSALATASKWLRRQHPTRVIVLGYLSWVVLGGLALCLPLTHQAGPVAWNDALFTAASAISTTGLVTVDPGSRFTLFGEAVILGLIQLGGLGYMTLGSFVLLVRHGPLDDFHSRVSKTALSLPHGMSIESVVWNVVSFTFVFEAVGSVALYIAFHASGTPVTPWQAVFHSISAFCTAGFSLFSTSLEAYRADVPVNLIVSVLSLAGAVGFIVWTDLADGLRQRRAVTLTSKIILGSTAAILIGGTLLCFILEPSLQDLPSRERLLASWFHTMSATTTVGFNTHATALFGPAIIVLTLGLMMVGASPAGTGGGVKTTSLAALTGLVSSSIRGHNTVTFFGRRVPVRRVQAAAAATTLYALALTVGIFLLSITETGSLELIAFEVFSALGTVGLSRGLTSQISLSGSLVLSAIMVLGRIGPISMGIAIAVGTAEPTSPPVPSKTEDLAV